MAEPETPPGEVRLAREITFLDATMLGVGALMGGGVFVLLGLAAGVAGNGVIIALFLNGLVTIPTLMVYAELGSASDDAGGGYLWVKQGLGQPFGFLGGWFGWFSHVIACAVYSIASATFLMVLLTFAGWIEAEPAYTLTLDVGAASFDLTIGAIAVVAVALCALFVGLNYIGIKIGIGAENVINSVVLVIVLIFIGAGLWSISQNGDLLVENFTPFWLGGGTAANLSGIFLAMGITFIAFEGYEIISQTSEEIQDPKRNIPRAIWTAFLIVWIIMLLVAFIALGATDAPDGGQAWTYLGGQGDRAIILMADEVMAYGTVIIAGAALLLQVTALNATLYSSSRVAFAMGRDGNLPRSFGRVHPKRRTPHVAVLWSGVLAVIMAASFPIHTVAASADVMFLLLFMLVNFSYIKLRKVIPPERFGYRAPFFPYLPLLGIFSQFFLAVYLWRYSQVAWYVTGIWIGLGLLAYYLYVRPREQPETAPPPVAPLPRPVVRPPRKDYRILALLSSPAPSTARALARAAGSIAKALDGEVVLLQPILVPDVLPLSEGQRFLKDQTLLDEARRAVPTAVPVHATVRIGHSMDAMVREVVREEGTSLILMSGQARATVGQPTSPLLAYPPCDVAVLRLKTPEVTAHKVLLSVLSPHQAGIGIRLGTALAKAHGGVLTMYDVRTPGKPEETTALRGRNLLEHHQVAGVKTEHESDEGPVVRKVLDKSRGHDLVVVGATVAQRPWRKSLFGPRTQEIADRVAGNVLIVRTGAGMGGPQGNIFGRTLMQLRRYFLPE